MPEAPPLDPQVPPAIGSPGDRLMTWIRAISCLGILAMNVYILIFKPDVTYTPMARGLLYFLTAAAAAVLFASTTSAVLKWTGKSVALTLVGSFVLVVVAFRLLVTADSPQEQMTAYEIVDQAGQAITLDAKDQVNMGRGRKGLQPTFCVDGNKMLLVFPEQLTQVELAIEHPPGSRSWYRGTIGYVGTQTYSLKLGRDLR